MADNVLVDNGTGTDYTVASDEVAVNGGSTAQVQYVKLVDGTANGTDGLPGGTQGLWVVPRRNVLRIQTTSGGLTTSVTAYTAGDQVGTMFSFANAARASGGTGRIVGCTLLDETDIIGAYDVVICRSNITLAADNAAFAISDADALNVVGIISLSGAFDITNNRLAQAFNLSIPYDCSGGTTLYAALITRVGHTFFGATTSLKLTLWVERD